MQAPESYEPVGETVRITIDVEELKKLRDTKNYADVSKFYSKLDEIIKYAEINNIYGETPIFLAYLSIFRNCFSSTILLILFPL